MKRFVGYGVYAVIFSVDEQSSVGNFLYTFGFVIAVRNSRVTVDQNRTVGGIVNAVPAVLKIAARTHTRTHSVSARQNTQRRQRTSHVKAPLRRK